MATPILHANELTQKKWSETVFKWKLANMLFSQFMGVQGTPEGSNSPIVTNQDLSKDQRGDQIIFRLRAPITDAGGHDDSKIEGNEATLSWYNMPLIIHERSQGVVPEGKMTMKRTAIDILKEGFESLVDWAAEQEDNDIVWSLCGLGNQGGYVGEGATEIATVNEKAPSTNRILRGGQTLAGATLWVATDALIGAAGATDPEKYLFGTSVISKLKLRASLASPKFRPIKWNGKSYYILVCHPLQLADLRAGTGENSWNTIQAAANLRGPTNPVFERQGTGEDRMFDGAVGVWDDVVIFTSDRMPTRVAGGVFHSSTDILHANIVSGTYRVARCVLMGAQAAVVGYGQQWQRHTKDFDYNRTPGVAMDALYGVGKAHFRNPGLNQAANDDTEDFSVYCCDTACREQ